eukprot:365871-Chlamydomonas_euryale.AAC.5
MLSTCGQLFSRQFLWGGILDVSATPTQGRPALVWGLERGSISCKDGCMHACVRAQVSKQSATDACGTPHGPPKASAEPAAARVTRPIASAEPAAAPSRSENGGSAAATGATTRDGPEHRRAAAEARRGALRCIRA